MTEKLSTRLAAATELTLKLREECAWMLGWRHEVEFIGKDEWWHGPSGQLHYGKKPPELHLGEIVAEIERRGWLSAHDTGAFGCLFMVEESRATRSDRNIQLCAMTALAMAIEGEN